MIKGAATTAPLLYLALKKLGSDQKSAQIEPSQNQGRKR
jgi:hypothetical protein